MRSLFVLFILCVGTNFLFDVCAGEPIAKETQRGQPISIGAYSNYNFSDCTEEEPPVINIIKKPIHGDVVILHRTHLFKPSDSAKCAGKPAEFSIVIYEPSRTHNGIVEIEYEVVFLTYKETGLVKEPTRFTYLVNVK
jgi:hypothetical protein